MSEKETTFKTGSSIVVEACQICGHSELEPILFLGYMPPVNAFHPIGQKPHEQPSYPAQVLNCPACNLVQLGSVVDSAVLFPAEYPYTSSTTKVLRDNFAQLYEECSEILNLQPEDLIVDVGSNDGNLLSNFQGNHKVLGITPEDIGKLAIEKGIPTILDYFTPEVVQKAIADHGKAKVVTATNVFAHIEKPNEVTKLVAEILTEDGVFISESHYFPRLVETLQYDTVYHEHLRYYSLHSLAALLSRHGLEVFHAREIPPHGGSIRVYAARKGTRQVRDSVEKIKQYERDTVLKPGSLKDFAQRVVLSKLALHSLISGIKKEGGRIYGIGAPSRASTLINYAGLDERMVDSIMEVSGSHKIGKYIPGTLIPVEAEAKLYDDQPEYALLFSWHIADELAPKLREKGYNGKFIVPLPEPRILESA